MQKFSSSSEPGSLKRPADSLGPRAGPFFVVEKPGLDFAEVLEEDGLGM
jgi:hypothetical protein